MTDKQPAPVGDCHIVGKAVVPEFSQLETAAKAFEEALSAAGASMSGSQLQALSEAMTAYHESSMPSVILSLLRKNADLKEDRRIAACVNAFDGIPTERIEGKDLGQILAGELRLNSAGPKKDGGFGFEFSGGVCQLLAEAYADQFKQSGAINYLELLFDHTEIGPLTITMQRVEGLTPAQKLAKVEAERDALAAELSRLRKQKPMAQVAESFIFFLRRQDSGECWPVGTKLYTEPRPTAPVVSLPDEMPKAAYEILYSVYPESAYRIADEIWSACRAEVLKINSEPEGIIKSNSAKN